MKEQSLKNNKWLLIYDLSSVSTGTFLQYLAVHPVWSNKILKQMGKKQLPYNSANLPILFRGFWLHLARALPVSAIQVQSANAIRDRVKGTPEIVNFYSGIVGGILSGPLVTATDAVMTQQKLNGGGVYDQTKEIYKNRGLKGFTSGGVCTALRNAGRVASYFSVYPALYNWTIYYAAFFKRSETEQHLYANAVATLGGGLFSTAVTNPPDVIKTVQQSVLGDKNQKGALTISGATRRILQKEGVFGLFTGMSHRLFSRTWEVAVMGLALMHVPKLLDRITGENLADRRSNSSVPTC